MEKLQIYPRNSIERIYGKEYCGMKNYCGLFQVTKQFGKFQIVNNRGTCGKYPAALYQDGFMSDIPLFDSLVKATKFLKGNIENLI